MGDSEIVSQNGVTLEKASLWVLNIVLVALMVWNFQRTEEATRKLDVTAAILERIEVGVAGFSVDRYTSRDAQRDWDNQRRINAMLSDDIKDLEQALRNLREMNGINTRP